MSGKQAEAFNGEYNRWYVYKPLYEAAFCSFLFTYIQCILILSQFYSPTDAQLNCLKNNIKIYIKTAPTCFSVITIIRERTI